MFTINVYLRHAITVVSFILGIILTLTINFWYALPFFLIGIVLVVGFILFGTIQSASKMLEVQDMAGADKRLDMTWNPNWLYKTNRAFFYILKGSIASYQKDNTKAEHFLKQAKDIELPSDNERAMVELQLANINVQRGNWRAAQNSMKLLKKFKVSQPEIRDQIKQFEQVIKNRGLIKQQRMMGMKQGSRKKRRPKMK